MQFLTEEEVEAAVTPSIKKRKQEEMGTSELALITKKQKVKRQRREYNDDESVFCKTRTKTDVMAEIFSHHNGFSNYLHKYHFNIFH